MRRKREGKPSSDPENILPSGEYITFTFLE
jgi:hypothetical protein